MIANDILSYYRIYKNGDKREEFLRNHIEDGLSLVENLNNSRLGKFVTNRLRVTNFEDLVRLTVILHDAGKAFYQTEKNLREDKGEKYLSFMGHEFVSAYIAERFVREKNMRRFDPNSYSIVFAIYFHHHAMGIKDRIARVAHRLKTAGPSLTEFKTMKEKLKEILESFIESEDREIIRGCLDKLLLEDLTNSAINSITNEINERIVHSGATSIKKLSFIVLDCLLACDYMSAKDRDGGLSEFFRALSSFYDVWMRV